MNIGGRSRLGGRGACGQRTLSTYAVAKSLAVMASEQAARRPRPLCVIDAVGRASGYTVAALRGPSRAAHITTARHIAFYLLQTDCGLPSTRTGELMGGRDHSTVLYGVRRIKASLAGSEKLRKLVAQARALALEAEPW